MKELNLNLIMLSGLTFLFILIFYEKNLEGIKILGLLLTHVIVGYWSYKRGKDDN